MPLLAWVWVREGGRESERERGKEGEGVEHGGGWGRLSRETAGTQQCWGEQQQVWVQQGHTDWPSAHRTACIDHNTGTLRLTIITQNSLHWSQHRDTQTDHHHTEQPALIRTQGHSDWPSSHRTACIDQNTGQAWPIMVAHSPQATKNVCGRPEVPQVLAHVASKKM